MAEEKRTITVYNKSGKRISEFSNQDNPNSAEAQKNLMVSPIVSNTSNGESTLTFQMLADSEKWQEIKDPENIYECGGRHYTALNEGSITYNGAVVEVVLVETWYLLKRVFVQAYNVDTNIEAIDEHTVKILPRTPEIELKKLMEHNGNVDLLHRKKVYIDSNNIKIVHGWGMEDAKVGDYMTVASQTFIDEKNGAAIVVTPILPDTSLLTQNQLENHINSVMRATKDKDYASKDSLGIIMGVFADSTREENLKKSDYFCERVHTLHEGEYILTVNGKKYDDSEVRDSKGTLMPRGSAGYALWAILKGTDWKLGICDVLPDKFDASKDYGTFNVESDMKSALENIQFIRDLYGGILVWDSKDKTVSLRDERKDTEFNQWKGFEVRKDKNLTELPVVVWDNKLITRLYPLGNGNLNIKKVNGGKNYIDNFSYTNAVYEAYIQNPNIYDTRDDGGQKTLKAWAERKLEGLCKPRKKIQYNIVDVRNTEQYSYDTFDINDIVKAYYIDTETGEEVSEFLRIQNLSYNYFFPASDSTIEVGDKTANERELFLQIYKKSENSTPTDNKGNISGGNIWVELPEDWQGGFTNLNNALNITAQKNTSLGTSLAEFKTYAGDTYATIESFTSYRQSVNGQLTESATKITQLSDSLTAQINLEAEHYTEVSGKFTDTYASINAVADDLAAQVKLEANHYDGLSDNVASVELLADKNRSAIKLKADKTYVDNLDVAGMLTAGSISTSKLSLEGKSGKTSSISGLVRNLKYESKTVIKSAKLVKTTSGYELQTTPASVSYISGSSSTSILYVGWTL